MKRAHHLFLATALLAAGTAAWAQQSAPAADRKPMREMRQQMQDRLKAADTDKDGQLSRAEVEKAMPHLAARFDDIDTNKDGKLSTDELKAMAQHMQRGPHGAHGDHMQQIDTDHDGQISRAEMEAHAQKMFKDFDAVDTNHDGKLSKEEMRAWHDKNHPSRPAKAAPPADPVK